MNKVLIVGSAPTIKRHIKKIKSFSGHIWALNDALFWLEKNKVMVNKAFITDSRFIRKALQEIINSICNDLIVLDTVEIKSIIKSKKISILKNLGRDGFSLKKGEVFHGCSVFFTALQTAVQNNIKEISVCGVLFPPPNLYYRINGTKNLPEYVHSIQVNNANLALKKLFKLKISIKIYERESNLNLF